MAIQISGCTVIDNNRNVIAGIVTASIFRTVVTSITPLGSEVEGGNLICLSSSVGWIVAPFSSEIESSWTNRSSAISSAELVSGCTGWFIPSCAQLLNPGYNCRTYWDAYTESSYWSNTQYNATHAWIRNFSAGSSGVSAFANTNSVRAFRCVTY